MKAKFVWSVSLAVLLLTACSGTMPTMAPTSPATPVAPSASPTVAVEATATVTVTPEPPVTSERIGPDGGSITSAEGALRLDFPPGALTASTEVTLRSYPAEGGVAAPVLEISLDPSPAAPLPVAARLTWLQAPADAPDARLVRRMTWSASTDANGVAQPGFDYWLPLETTRRDPDDRPVVWLTRFSFYSAIPDPFAACEPDPAVLEPPETPLGYVYIGRLVYMDEMYNAQLSNLRPGDYQATPYSHIQLVQEGECAVRVLHVFVPRASSQPEKICWVPEPNLAPPPTPPGYEHAGRIVTVDGVYGSADSTLPEGWGGPADARTLVHQTAGKFGSLRCVVSVTHYFTPIPPTTGPAAAAECDPTPEQLAPPETPSGFVYVGVEVIINGTPRSDLSTVPPTYAPAATDHVLSSGSSRTRNGVQICDTKVRHIFAREQSGGACGTSAAALTPPPVPEGYVYVGREVVINKVLQEELSTAPPGRPGTPDDVVFVSSESAAAEAVTSCDTVVTHIFTPKAYAGEQVPDAWLVPPVGPKCASYVGYEALYNWQPVVSTLHHDQVLKPEAGILAPQLGTDVSVASPFQVGHWFVPGICPVCTQQIPSGVAPTLTSDGEGNTVVQFGADANLTEADVEQLRRSARASSWSSTGERTFTLPPGTQATFENGSVTITLDAAYCE